MLSLRIEFPSLFILTLDEVIGFGTGFICGHRLVAIHGVHIGMCCVLILLTISIAERVLNCPLICSSHSLWSHTLPRPLVNVSRFLGSPQSQVISSSQRCATGIGVCAIATT